MTESERLHSGRYRCCGTVGKEQAFFGDVDCTISNTRRMALVRLIIVALSRRITEVSAITEKLPADIEEKVYKLLFMDVGLMNANYGLGWNTISQIADTQLINEGVIAEQFIGQHLQDMLSGSPNRDLTYWLREGRSSNAEVDYVIALDGKIIPIEIKAGATGSLKSLHQFVGEKGVRQAVRFDTGLPSTQVINTRIRRGEKPVANRGGGSHSDACAYTAQ